MPVNIDWGFVATIHFYPPRWLLAGMLIGYALFMVSGVGLAIIRRTALARLKAFFANLFTFSCAAMMLLGAVLIFSKDGETNWLAFWVSLVLCVGFCTMVIVWQMMHPVDWSKPFDKSGLVSEEKAVLSSAMTKIWYGKGGPITAAEKAAIDAAIARLK